MNDTELSKALSHALRHEPWLYELELDDAGWAPLDAVLNSLRRERAEWEHVSREDLERAIVSSGKRRHEIAGDRIRALYGHSLPGKLQRARAEPPRELFHGTSPNAAPSIDVGGLLPVSRQYVHLSPDIRVAREVGERKSRHPVLYAVDAAKAWSSGVAFYAGNERVWLADSVPPAFLHRRGWGDPHAGGAQDGTGSDRS